MSIASLYPSINPSLLLDFANSKVLDSRVTFTRTTTATYYDGVTTAVAEQNLFQYSQQMNTSPWETVVSTATEASTTAPDGTSTGNTINQSSTGVARVRQTQAFSNAVTHTFSAYVKAGTSNYAAIAYSEQNWECYAKINLSTGAIQEAGNFTGRSSYVSSSITSVGNSWYRVTLTFVAVSGSSTDYIHIITTDSTTWVGQSSPVSTTSAGSIYAWGAQLEQRSSATAYTATTTQAITNYIPVLQTASAGQARFDHNPTTGESLGLLIEEARTNLRSYSADFTNAVWTTNASSITTNAVIAPDGTLTADVLVESSTTAAHYVQSSAVSVSSGASYTFTVYAKSWYRSVLQILFNGGDISGDPRANFDLSTGVLGSVDSGITATITSVGNGWYRCSCSFTTATTNNYPIICIQTSTTASRAASYAGNGFSGIFIWGAQLEAGSFATSYIPTVASTATRNADAASMTGTNFSSWFNNGEGTLYAEASTSAANTAKRFAQIDSGAESNRIQIAAEASGTTKNFAVVTNSSTQAYTPVSASYPVKVGAGYKVNDFGASFNGGAIQTDTSGTVPALSVMRFGAASDASENMNGCLRKVSYYPAKATSAQIVGLTT